MSLRHVDKTKILQVTVILFGGICAFLSGGHYAFAADGCSVVSGASLLRWNINPGTLVVQRDMAVGETIKQITLNSVQYGKSILDCDPAALHSYLSERPAVPGYSGYFDTGVPGVGMKITSPGGMVFNNPPTTWISGSHDVVLNPSFKITFIKTGNISPGAFTTGEIFKWSAPTPVGGATGVLDVGIGNISGGSVSQVACSVTTSNVNVGLGNILATKFTGVGHTEGDKAFNIGLNCDAGANVNVTLSGRQNQGTSNASVLGITNSGSAGVASGLGVQILYNNQPLEIGKKMILKAANGGQESFPLTARYYQTQSAVTVGQANATATINLTYQ